MKHLYPVLAAEGLKLKRTLALRLAIWCPTVIVLLVFGIYAGRSEELGDIDLLTGFAQLTLTIWTIVLFPPEEVCKIIQSRRYDHRKSRRSG